MYMHHLIVPLRETLLQLWVTSLHGLNSSTFESVLHSEGIEEVLAADTSVVFPIAKEHSPETLQGRPASLIDALQHIPLEHRGVHSTEAHALLLCALPVQDTAREGVQHGLEQRLQLRGQRVGPALESADSCK